MEAVSAMLSRFFRLLTKLAINALALLAADALLDGIRFDTDSAKIAAVVVMALANAYLRPLLMVLTLPLNILSLGLFTLLINALLLKVVSWVIPAFHVEGFWTAVGGALVISLVSVILNWFIRPPTVQVRSDRR
jgi:putative membrane protein